MLNRHCAGCGLWLVAAAMLRCVARTSEKSKQADKQTSILNAHGKWLYCNERVHHACHEQVDRCGTRKMCDVDATRPVMTSYQSGPVSPRKVAGRDREDGASTSCTTVEAPISRGYLVREGSDYRGWKSAVTPKHLLIPQ